MPDHLIPGVSVVVAEEPVPDPRDAIFWRDMEACTRAHSPAAAARMAASLIRRRAGEEAMDRRASGLTGAQSPGWIEHRKRELWRQATAMGLLSPTLYHYEVRFLAAR